ncbi:hypothetical protein [Pyxidicoccus sp. MSG2]|uniref:hypothetical protein n=1 Tax=Pyxidicoccus sp. MSG2 TaxID=2996790 RepID=UPI0022700091|nr:hypothetical protein [Pyxidicoccus sp. MSG2]MCY1021027.1 hypothetical protein [Pyxidicoccus sp. MSG2]
MTERSRTRIAPREEHSPEDVRRRLEGGAEVLDAARARHVALETVLRSRRWMRRLRARPELVSEWRKHEPEVAEALERAKRRARAEDWPEDTPVRRTLRELEACRTRLEALVRRRLMALAPVPEPPSLEAGLVRLDALARRKVSRTLAPGEVLVLKGWQIGRALPRDSRPWTLPLFLLAYVLYLVLMFPLGLVIGEWALLGIAAFLVLPMLWRALRILSRLGRFWLTRERLVWRPVFGAAESVSLSSIPPGGVHLELATDSVRVDGEVRVHMHDLRDATRLAVLLELHRQLPLPGAARAASPGPTLILPGSLQGTGESRESGQAILRPEGVSFIPGSSGAAALQALSGQHVGLPVMLDQVLEHLRALPEAEFDARVARLADALDGVHWPATEASPRDVRWEWNKLHVTRDGRSLVVSVDLSLQATVERVLRAWGRFPGAGDA